MATEPALGDRLRESAARYLGDEAAPILAARQLDERLLPICHYNVTILAELAGLPDPDRAGYEFAVPYGVLLTHCDLLDAAVDGEATEAADLLGLAGTLAWFWSMVEEEILPRVDPAARGILRQAIRSRLTERSGALRREVARRQTWEPPDEIDAAAAAGRSACVVLFYELLCGIAGRPPNPAVISVLADYLHAFQLGDDLGDWESDLAAGNQTALLRGCAARLGSRATYRREELARELFLGGYYELYAARLVRAFDRILARIDQLDNVRADRLREYVAGKRADTHFLLTEVVRAKLESFASGPGGGEDRPPRMRRTRLGYPLFRRLIHAASRQPEYRAMYGGVWWWVLWQLRFFVYLWYRRRGRSRTSVLVVERGDAVLAAIGLTPSGELSTAIIVGTPAEQRAAMRLLGREIDRELRMSTRRHWATTRADFHSLIAALERRGFELTPSTWSTATLPLGPLTWTWTTQRHRLPWVRLVPQIRLVRPARQSPTP